MREQSVHVERDKQVSFDPCEALAKQVGTQKAGMFRFFSDEKNFDQDQKVNRRNDRW